jgi:ribonucleoside-diphosphate reductase alpha chain
MNDYQKYIHLSKYARFRDTLGRRETWPETVRRYCGFIEERVSQLVGVDDELLNDLYLVENAILNMDIMPSMRAMMTAGRALKRDHLAAYNCAAIAVNNPRVFDEVFFILMNGGGVGFSVERQFINQLPEVAEHLYDSETTIVVHDSKGGWSKALKELIALLYNGDVPKWDMSGVRAAGERLKTFGGRASGPEPLDLLFRKTVALFKRAAGRKLNSLECHDLLCQIADTVIVGGVRRSAMISMSNLTDDRMRRCKTGEFYLTDPQRFLANNSVMYTEKPDLDSFLGEFRSMYKSRAGERGMVNQKALREKAISCDRDPDQYYLLNPCGY